jgi:hypothetical protein
MARFLMAVNRKLPKERLNLDPGLMGKTKFREQIHLKRFWNDSQLREIREVTSLNLEDLLPGESRSNAGRIPPGPRGSSSQKTGRTLTGAGTRPRLHHS